MVQSNPCHPLDLKYYTIYFLLHKKLRRNFKNQHPRTLLFLKSNTKPKNPDGSYENPQVLELGIGGPIREGSNFENQHPHTFLMPRIQHKTQKNPMEAL